MQLVIFDAGTTSILKGDELIRLRRGVISDISLTGVCIETEDLEDRWIFNMLSGTIKIALKFQLKEDASPINTATRVMWVKKSEHKKKLLGLKFEEINEADRFQIMQYIIAYKSAHKDQPDEST